MYRCATLIYILSGFAAQRTALLSRFSLLVPLGKDSVNTIVSPLARYCLTFARSILIFGKK